MLSSGFLLSSGSIGISAVAILSLVRVVMQVSSASLVQIAANVTMPLHEEKGSHLPQRMASAIPRSTR